MRPNNLFSRGPISALLLALLLTACGEKPESMLNSAKDYLAKNDAKAAIIQVKNALQANPDSPDARFLLGKALLETGDAVGAETELRKALALKVPQDQVVPLLAKAMLIQGQAKKVTEEFGKTTLSQGSANAELQTSLASAFAMEGKGEQSNAALAAALRADPAYDPALLLQVRQKAFQRDVDGAMAGVDAVIAKSPKNFEAWKLKGDLSLYLKNQPDEALVAFRKSVEVRPDYMAAHASAVRVLFQQNKLEEVDKQLAGLKTIAPNHPQTKFFEAQLAYQRKDFKLARSLSQQVLKSAPNNALGLQLAGATELALNSPLQAESFLSKAVQLAPQMAMARRLLAATYARTGNTAKAIATITPGLANEPVDPELLSLAGEVYLQSGDAKKAEEFFAKAIKQDPQNARRRTALAVSQMMTGHADAAFSELEQIATSDKGTVADMALISAHLRRNEFDKALKAIDALEKKQPDKPGAAILQGRTYLAKKDPVNARKSFERALSMEPTFFPAVASLAGLDIAEKKPEEAKKRFEALLAKEPKNGQALLALAELAARSGAGKDEVGKLINNAVAANPAEMAPRLLLINFHLNNKDLKQALSAAQDAQTAVPDSPELLDALGRTQQATGDFNQAIVTYNKLATLQPMSPQPHMRLADVHMAAKNKEAAAQSLRKALEIKPDMQQAQRGSILLDVDGKNYQSAITTARTMQAQGPNQAIGYVLEGDINATEKKWDAAGTAYRNGLKQTSSTELALKLHNVLMASGKTADADQFSAKWQKEHPQDAAFVLYLADGAIARKDYPLAERNYQAVLKLQPNNAVAYNNLAWVTAKLNKDGAIAYAEKALTIAPNQPAFMDTLATLLSDKNEHAKAMELQKKVIALQPDAPLFKLNLAKIQIKAGDKAGAKVTLGELAKLGDKFGGQAEVAALLKGL
jgi:putative PEP-CTERM system TPR-repeat lipoprotein